ncbi:YkgJ family cysteine cluster protein [Reichenbachiella agarivorans]|uniref:YkgJ family cysteine cluster protein n=1 Tax=Reichenbachiella agarivorans TaxID=2979464 RepID=A0ABY6CRH2_9BACT|nr:YkgJ family cysteine cluster protein [Reichenbachiella agarivorans]UXP31963.1 YkgJ family cysteine cluster protein [Reichenbachiella agarivorans]
MSESSNICLSCGCCCDGTLIGFVQLAREEVPALRNLLEIENTEGEGFFLQPCQNLGCDGCTIYTNRPTACADFDCGLLTSLNQKEIAYEEAIEVIAVVKQKKIAIEQMMEVLPFTLQSQSFYFKVLELKKLMRKDVTESTVTQDHPTFLAEVDQLDALLSEKFGVSFS